MPLAAPAPADVEDTTPAPNVYRVSPAQATCATAIKIVGYFVPALGVPCSSAAAAVCAMPGLPVGFKLPVQAVMCSSPVVAAYAAPAHVVDNNAPASPRQCQQGGCCRQQSVPKNDDPLLLKLFHSSGALKVDSHRPSLLLYVPLWDAREQAPRAAYGGREQPDTVTPHLRSRKEGWRARASHAQLLNKFIK